ncbi:helix-turn-helix transcriptional regulator [Actinomadura harenae]|uniref:XRE family transcriptional regulator n=1 Tax=Actinomadura harenae TaxID=2483351 RepID=A0A3M2M4R0_9ACTN|nr:helix-turn-helix transcriptional regulator [Actinomadura harenae]RMI42108.1 XRE family transcriptional regulator [Actinomadura harenae]
MTADRRRLAHRRRAMGLTQEQLADRVGTERTTIGRWERAETAPYPYQLPRLAQVLGMTLDELDDLLGEGEPVEEESNGRLDHALRNPAAVDHFTVAHLQQRVQQLNAAYDATPSALLLADAGQCHGQVTYLRDNTSGGPIRRSLGSVEARSALFMGQLVWDASQRRDHLSPRRYFQQAAETAREIHDVVTEAQAQLRMSYVDLYGVGDPASGLVQASRAARLGRHASEVLTGLALLHVAEAHAMMKAFAPCEKALAAAEQAFAKVGRDDTAIEHYSPTQYGRMAGSCYLFLGDPRRAQAVLEETEATLHPWRKSRSIVLGNLALAHLRQSDLDGATERLHQALDLLEQNRGGGGLNVAFQAGRELAPWRDEPAVQDVHDRMFALMTN